MSVQFVARDFVRITSEADAEKKITLAWGDPVEVLGTSGGRTRVSVPGRGSAPFLGSVRGNLSVQARGVLQLAMVDVQQGDGMVLQTPGGRVILIDGGDNKLFARYLAARFRGSTEAQPQRVDAIVITHGDADHFAGLSEISKSEEHAEERKRLFLLPARIFHNGLVKGPSKDANGRDVPADVIFGTTVATPGGRAVVDLETDLRNVAQARMNLPFKTWVKTIRQWAQRGSISMRRLAFGDGAAFDFLAAENVRVSVLGPLTEKVAHNGAQVDALPLLHDPPRTVDLDDAGPGTAFSASHTINGHSIVLRIEFGNVRILLTGDLNKESMDLLRQRLGDAALQAEVVKIPHHGSADFDFPALKAMSPVVSLISSGDESAKKEHIHPRATMMGAVGLASRPTQNGHPLVFCTELAAFFSYLGELRLPDSGRAVSAFERTNFGIIHVRTDGERVLVFTHSGKEDMKEAYRFRVDSQHRVRFEDLEKQ